MQNTSMPAPITFGSADPIFRKEPGEYLSKEEQDGLRQAFDRDAKDLIVRRFTQTASVAISLREKYKCSLIGKVDPLQALLMLGMCYDETDTELYGISQLTHSLQVADAMERSGVVDETMILAAIIHDFGKITSLFGEAPEHTDGPNEVISGPKPGCGLDQTLVMWNHDEFGYQKLKDFIPDHVGWLVRYHSLRFETATAYMDDRDREYYNKYLIEFRKYDLGSKSLFSVPSRNLLTYRSLFERYFPKALDI